MCINLRLRENEENFKGYHLEYAKTPPSLIYKSYNMAKIFTPIQPLKNRKFIKSSYKTYRFRYLISSSKVILTFLIAEIFFEGSKIIDAQAKNRQGLSGDLITVFYIID
ncbi:hypothetical protein BpHYR1_016247 [Brachionus plicatilis]|uniref:Uncharacterized protein n=1 Tax=Brachionus plicatilis TaxID=10195 RepID=A0A3M7RID9_BRAPC|nr:hypothetical protein BpHYR1_016247 [Brachionus plicatilis]